MMPTNVAARMTLAADPNSLQGAVAAGILGCGPVLLGTSEECARLLAQGGDPAEHVRAIAAAGGKVPGFGHPVHKPLDPRAERILELADERGVSGPNVALARRYREAVHAVWGKPLTMNVSMPIAAVMLDLGLPARDRQGRADPRAHREPARAPRRGAAGAGRLRHGPRGRGRDRVRAGLTVSDARELPGAAGVPVRALGVLPREADRGRLPHRLRRRRTGRHRAPAADREGGDPRDDHGREPGRRPPLRGAGGDRPDLLHERHDGHAELHPAHRGRPGELDRHVGAQLRGVRGQARRADRQHLQRRAVRRGRRARRVRPHRPLPHPGRDRQHRAPHADHRAAAAPRRGAHPVLRRLRRRVRGRARDRPGGVERPPRARRRASRAAASRRSARSSRPAGARA